MATAYPKNDPPPDIFGTVEQEIMSTFENLIGQIITRRDVLLEEIRKLKMDFQEKIRSQEKTLKDLEAIRIQLQDISQKENKTSDLLQSSLAPIEKQISELQATLIQPTNLHFSCETQTIVEMIRKLGKIEFEKSSIDYTSKRRAKQLIEISNVNSIHIDDTYLYVSNNQSITTYDTTYWELKGCYKLADTITINGIATIKSHCYTISINRVSSNFRHVISKFSNNRFELIKQQSTTAGTNMRLCVFTSIAVSSEEELFVVDGGNNRICVFDSNLFYRREFGTETLKVPTLIQIKENKVFVKDNETHLHLFNKQGDYIGKLPKYENIRSIICFCFDSADNMIFTYCNDIRIISAEGELLHAIKRSEDLTGSGPIALYKDNIIVACSGTNSIKIF